MLSRYFGTYYCYLVVVLLVGSSVSASDHPKVDQDIKVYKQHVRSMDADFQISHPEQKNIEWVKKKIQHMVDIDQYMRKYWDTPFNHQYSDPEKAEFQTQFMVCSNELDSKNTNELKDLLKSYPWFTIGTFDIQTDRNAWLLVQHADQDISFQKEVLKRLSSLYLKGETSPANYAYLFDRIASSPNNPKQRVLQRYGTQGSCVGPGRWEPFPVEDPVRLDDRRKQMGLESEAEYILRFKSICH
jgi:hypothetical protein